MTKSKWSCLYLCMCLFSRCKMFSFPAQRFGCVLSSQVWVAAYMRPPAHSRGGKGKSYLHPVKLFLMVSKFHQMAFLNGLQSAADHRTSQTEAKPAFTNPKIGLRTNFNFTFSGAHIHSQLCKVSTNAELYNYIFQQQHRNSN